MSNQLNLLQQNNEGYLLLLEAENEKFNFGESSVFLLNKRQEKLIEGRIKFIKQNTKLNAEMLFLIYSINGLL